MKRLAEERAKEGEGEGGGEGEGEEGETTVGFGDSADDKVTTPSSYFSLCHVIISRRSIVHLPRPSLTSLISSGRG